MGEITKVQLKTYFERGDRPTEQQFIDLIDTLLNQEDSTRVVAMLDAHFGNTDWRTATGSGGGVGDGIESVTSSDNHIQVDNTDSLNPVLSWTLVDNENLLTDDELAAVQTIGDKQDKATQGTTFDDSGAITVATTVQYSTVRTVTGSTHTLTAATTGNVIGQYKLARYTFNVDCDLTLTDFDTIGSTLGTVNPIPAGTYNLWFYTTAFGVALVIQNNTGTTPGTLSTPAIIISAGNASLYYIISAIDGNATGGVLEYSTDNSNWLADEDYSFGTNTGTMDGLSDGTLYYVRFRVSASGYLPSAYITGTGTPSLALTALTAPTANTPTANTASKITVTCDDHNTSPQEITMLFRRATNSSMSTGLTTVQLAAGTTSYQWTGLTQSTTYYFDVIAQGDGVSTTNSVPSNVVSAATPSNIILSADFAGATIDTAKFDVANPNTPIVTITQNNGLILFSDGGSAFGSTANNVKTDLSFTGDFVVRATLAKTDDSTSIPTCGFGVYVDDSNRAMYQNAGDTGNFRNLKPMIIDGGAIVLSTEVSVPFDSAVKIKKIGNTYSFWYRNGSTWTQIGTDQTYDIGASLKVIIYIGSQVTSPNQTYTVNDLYVTYDDYTELIPT